MPRRNNRVPSEYEPLDLTPDDVEPQNPHPLGSREGKAWWSERQARRSQEQSEARINGGISWHACLVPGCGNAPYFRDLHAAKLRDHHYAIPLCRVHLMTARDQAGNYIEKERDFALAVATQVSMYRQGRSAEEDAKAQAEFMADRNGDIYFIRIGDLIKVGWTRDMWSRLKSYGASAELLVCYPGTRDDETNLHRQLTPARVRGREWYEDGPIINGFLEDALRLYGPPQSFDGLWTEPKKTVRLRRRR